MSRPAPRRSAPSPRAHSPRIQPPARDRPSPRDTRRHRQRAVCLAALTRHHAVHPSQPSPTLGLPGSSARLRRRARIPPPRHRLVIRIRVRTRQDVRRHEFKHVCAGLRVRESPVVERIEINNQRIRQRQFTEPVVACAADSIPSSTSPETGRTSSSPRPCR